MEHFCDVLAPTVHFLSLGVTTVENLEPELARNHR